MIHRAGFPLCLPLNFVSTPALKLLRSTVTNCRHRKSRGIIPLQLGDDDYYQAVRRYGDTTDHGAQTAALLAVCVYSQWRTDLGFDDLDKSLDQGLPIVIIILHRGSLAKPTGGHMIVVIGRQGLDYICHDPDGSLLS